MMAQCGRLGPGQCLQQQISVSVPLLPCWLPAAGLKSLSEPHPSFLVVDAPCLQTVQVGQPAPGAAQEGGVCAAQ